MLNEEKLHVANHACVFYKTKLSTTHIYSIEVHLMHLVYFWCISLTGTFWCIFFLKLFEHKMFIKELFMYFLNLREKVGLKTPTHVELSELLSVEERRMFKILIS